MTDSEKISIAASLQVSLKTCLDNPSELEASIKYLVLSSTDGFVIADTLGESSDIDVRRLSAISASFAGISEGLAAESGLRNTKGSIVETESGLVVCRLLKTHHFELVLLGMFDDANKHGLALWSLNSISKKILEVLKTYNCST